MLEPGSGRRTREPQGTSLSSKSGDLSASVDDELHGLVHSLKVGQGSCRCVALLPLFQHLVVLTSSLFSSKA